MQWYILLLLFSANLLAYQTSVTPEGKELRWSNKNVPLVIHTNTYDLTPSQVREEIRKSMNEWNSSSTAKVREVSASVNEIRFEKNFTLGSGVIGLTEVSYNPEGVIQKAIIKLNDDYHFTNIPGFYGGSTVYLGDVITHELGHLFGLSHSEVLSSSMFYSSFSGQSTVSSDDRSGIRKKYDIGHGTIRGVVQGGAGIGVFGAHVQAISRRTGEVVGAISDENGDFVISGLDFPDSYYLYISPIKEPGHLPSYFSNVQTGFCPASYVGTFFSGCGKEEEGSAQGISLLGPESIDVGVVSIGCSLKSDEEYNYQKIQEHFSAMQIWNPQDSLNFEKAFVGHFRMPKGNVWSSYDLLNVDLTQLSLTFSANRYLKVNLVAWPFGNQLEYELRLLRNGIPYDEANILPNGPGTYGTDLMVKAPMGWPLDQNTFQIQVRARKLPNAFLPLTFPSQSFTSDSHLPYLLIMGLWEEAQDGSLEPLLSTSNLSDNAACLDAPFTYAVKRAKSLSETKHNIESQSAAVAGCGTIEPPGPGGPGSQLPLLCLGFVLSLAAMLIGKKTKNILS